MPFAKALEVGKPFYKYILSSEQTKQTEKGLYLLPAFYFVYRSLFNIYSILEPDNEWLKESESEEVIYSHFVNHDFYYAEYTEKRRQLNSGEATAYEEVLIKKTPLLEYLIEHYGKTYVYVHYSLYSRRRLMYQGAHVPEELYSLFELLGFQKPSYVSDTEKKKLSFTNKAVPEAENNIEKKRTVFANSARASAASFSLESIFTSFIGEDLLLFSHENKEGYTQEMIKDYFRFGGYIDKGTPSLSTLLMVFQEKKENYLARYESIEIPQAVTDYLEKKMTNKVKRRVWNYLHQDFQIMAENIFYAKHGRNSRVKNQLTIGYIAQLYGVMHYFGGNQALSAQGRLRDQWDEGMVGMSIWHKKGTSKSIPVLPVKESNDTKEPETEELSPVGSQVSLF